MRTREPPSSGKLCPGVGVSARWSRGARERAPPPLPHPPKGDSSQGLTSAGRARCGLSARVQGAGRGSRGRSQGWVLPAAI